MSLVLIFVLLLDFAISWANANYSGKCWSESKEIGGSFRVNVVIGYVMAIAGFTMVYGYTALLIAPFILSMTNMDVQTILELEQLGSDLIYLFSVISIVPIGFYVWFRSFKTFWEHKNVTNGLVAGWNTAAQLHNTVSAAREAPSALGRVTKLLFGKKRKANVYAVILAAIVLICAIFGGYFTASAILKKADRGCNYFEKFNIKYN